MQVLMMIPECPYCKSNKNESNQGLGGIKRVRRRERISGKKSFLVVKFGYYRRKKEARRITKFKCNECKKYFSLSTFEEEYYQKRRDINVPLSELLGLGLSQANVARFLKVNPKTVSSRARLLSK
jgi:transposase-like protein